MDALRLLISHTNDAQMKASFLFRRFLLVLFSMIALRLARPMRRPDGSFDAAQALQKWQRAVSLIKHNSKGSY